MTIEMKTVAALTSALMLVACGNQGPGDAAAQASGAVDSGKHVDCAAAAGGDGTSARPWNALEEVNALVLAPGDQLLLKRGTVCVGMLKPQGSGTAGNPVVIGTYGTGSPPRIDANGAQTAALHLEDLSYVVVQDLELTNQGNSDGLHRGAYVTAKTAAVREVVLRGLYIHNVDGDISFNGGKRGGGIIVDTAAAPARYDDVVIEDNRIEDVARSGIYIHASPSVSRPRATEAWPAAPSGVVVRRNALARIAGDGIVADGTSGALLEANVLDVANLVGTNYADFSNRNCSAGIWTWNSNNTVIQYNEVSGVRFGQSSTDGCDGTAFDIDYNQDGVIVQFNYSHDNEGGFVLLCSDDQPRSADIRYNLSLNDGHTFSAVPCKAPDAIGGFDGIRFFNNTIVAGAPNTSAENAPLPTLYNAGTFEFKNNIIYASQIQGSPIQCGDDCANNLFFNIPPSGSGFVIGDPLFIDPETVGVGRLEVGEGYKLRPGSPAIGAGTAVGGTAESDYFGNRIPATPTIGFYEPLP